MKPNTARLLQLIDQLLDLVHTDAGAVTLVREPVEPTSLARSVVGSFTAAAAERGIELKMVASAPTPSIRIDSAWIETALRNLIANAVRLVPRGGEVSIAVIDSGTDVTWQVRDNGPGIAPRDLSRTFERATQDSVDGTGLRLALVREAVRLHGGDVTAASVPWVATTFQIRVPRTSRQPAGSDVGIAPPTTPVPELRPGPFQEAPLVIVVEDNPELRTFLADVLAGSYRVHTARDGAAGLELALTLSPEAVISDVFMPRMDGYELCRALRAHEKTRSLPVLLLTAHGELEHVLEGFDAGADDYLTKPFHARELLARLEVHVRLRQMVRELAHRERLAMLGVLAASVAHQVRNPLTSIRSGLPVVRRKLGDAIDARTGELLDVIDECAVRIERLTTDLLDLSRVDREPTARWHPSEGIHSAIRLISARLPEAISLRCQLDEEAEIVGRPGDLNHVFVNLIDNATREVKSGGVVEVTSFRASSELIIHVDDTGPGIEAALAERIFEPFFTTRAAGEGTGLGLSTARKVVDQHGGRLSVGRSPLGGARFTVSLPLASARVPCENDQTPGRGPES
jgi:signal transduction histidine kinase